MPSVHSSAQTSVTDFFFDTLLEADPEKLRSIVDNLISNAVKFTPPGGVISVKARALAGGGVIEVMDSGPGVPPEERESIFNLFFRGRTKADTGVKGSGLGLAIARELVEAHGGQIAVIGGGAGGHFRVTLPRRQSARCVSVVRDWSSATSWRRVRIGSPNRRSASRRASSCVHPRATSSRTVSSKWK